MCSSIIWLSNKGIITHNQPTERQSQVDRSLLLLQIYNYETLQRSPDSDSCNTCKCRTKTMSKVSTIIVYGACQAMIPRSTMIT